MDDYDSFDAIGYLTARYGDPKLEQRWKYQLDKLHETFHEIRASPGSLRVLDFGCGPVIQHCISAVPYASEIVFCDLSAVNREAILKWLKKEPDAFNWSPKFDYVVKTLEGKEEKEARQREERMRSISKVVFGDIMSETPMEKGFEGPYDVIIECGCVNSACSELSSYKRCLKVLSSLLKPGGVYVNYSTNSEEVKESIRYPAGEQWYSCMHLPVEHVASILKKECGFEDNVYTDIIPLDAFTPTEYSKIMGQNGNGFHFISAKKKL